MSVHSILPTQLFHAADDLIRCHPLPRLSSIVPSRHAPVRGAPAGAACQGEAVQHRLGWSIHFLTAISRRCPTRGAKRSCSASDGVGVALAGTSEARAFDRQHRTTATRTFLALSVADEVAAIGCVGQGARHQSMLLHALPETLTDDWLATRRGAA